MQNLETIKNLLETCETAKDSVNAFISSINDFIAIVEALPAVAKPLVRRDLQSNTGMSADEWKAFLERLSLRYQMIHEATQHVADALAKKDETEVVACTAALNEASAPFAEGADVAAEELETMATYMEGLPAKINMVPDAFLKAEARDGLIASVPGRVVRARELKMLLEKTKAELSAATG
ncbi:MAG TPA: hypothetical protein VEB88_02410 [Candidatus Acidoferrales bacterium]|jgi:DNA polymerase III gamma/tau subunit|nr:hypothetical protein [Candidatus Acidoferrales bacterium]